MYFTKSKDNFSQSPVSKIHQFPRSIAMHFGLTFVASFAMLLLVCGAAELPSKFLGSWTVDHSENFDEYLEVNFIFFDQFNKNIYLLAGQGLRLVHASNGEAG
jgi:hypothetical protein